MAQIPPPVIDQDILADQIERALVRADREHLPGMAQKIAGNAFAVPSGTEVDRVYFVVFKTSGVIPNYSFACNCQAGLNGVMCKHGATALEKFGRIDRTGRVTGRWS